MKLQVLPLIDVQGVNDFVYASQIEMTQGDATDVYFQLVDGEKNLSQHGYNPPGLRYLPQAGATLQVTFINIDDASKVVRFATQPYAQDQSIWKISLLSTDPIAGTVNLKFVLTETINSIQTTKTTSTKAVISCYNNQSQVSAAGFSWNY